MADNLGWLKKLLGIHRVKDTSGNVLPSTHTFNFSGPTGAVAYNTSSGEIDIDLGASPIDLTDPDFVDPGTDNSVLYTNGSEVEWRTFFSFPAGVASPTISQDKQTGDNPTTLITLQGQEASDGATGSNVNGGSVVVAAGAGVTGGVEGVAAISGYRISYVLQGLTRLRWYGFSDTTTTATPLTMTLFAMDSNNVAHVSVAVTAKKSDGSQVAFYRKGALFKRVSGTTTQVGSTEDIGPDIEDDAAWDCTVDNSGDDIRVTVTGAASTTIKWDVTVEVVRGRA